MKSTTLWPKYRPQRAQIAGSAIILAACIVYFGALHILDGRAETYFKDLRQSDTQLYLTLMRQGQGFDTYLEEYREVEGYDSFQSLTPSFLVGRWTMRPAPIRLSPGTTPTVCSDPVTLNYGLLLEHETGGVELPVQYRIVGKTVELKNASLGILPIKLVSYGGQLDHIEFVPPGETEIAYGYLCGR